MGGFARKSGTTLKDPMKAIRENPLDPSNQWSGGMFKRGGNSPGPRADLSMFDWRQDVKDRVAPARDASQGLITQLQGSAKGEGPSIAEAQLKSATNRNLAQTMAAAASQRGGNAAAQQRQLLNQRAMANREVAETGAALRMQEAQQAQQLLGQLTQQQQQNDLQQIMGPAQQLGQYEQMRFAEDVAHVQGNKAAQNALLGEGMGIASTIGSAFAMSDKNQKTAIKSGSKDVSKFLDALSAKNYEYKDSSKPGTAPGKRVGVVAQDLEKSDMGKTMVKQAPDGSKMVDTVQGFGAVLAAQSELNRRLKKLEGK